MLQAVNLTFERFFEPVFEPVSFAVQAGQALLVRGDNGCGKTTLIRLLAGFLRPSGGRLEMNPGPIAYVGHQLALKQDLSVRENLTFTRNFLGHGQTTVSVAIDRVGLGRQTDQAARSLSAGQRKRCALARLLLQDSALWLLDEPYANLDPQGMAMLDTLLDAHLRDGGASVLTSHGSLQPQSIDYQDLYLERAGRGP